MTGSLDDKCRICGNQGLDLVCQKYDDRYGYPGIFKVYRCKHCKHGVTASTLDEKQLAALYTEYYPRKHMEPAGKITGRETSRFMNWLTGDASRAYRWVPRNVKVLDIGCGFGESLVYHENRGCEAWGIDVDENVARADSRLNIKTGFFRRELFEKDYFDYVTMDQVIEHVQEPLEFIREVMSVVKPGGYIVITTPNIQGWGRRVFGEKWINWHIPYHLHFFSHDSLKILASNAGLAITCYKTLTSSIWLHMQWMHLLLYPAEAEASPYWSKYIFEGVPGRVNSREKYLVRNLWRYRINDLVTRFFDLLHAGDNQLVIMQRNG